MCLIILLTSHTSCVQDINQEVSELLALDQRCLIALEGFSFAY